MKNDIHHRKDTIYEKAKNLIECHENKNKKRIKREIACLKAGICPVCGGPLELGIQKRVIKLIGLFDLVWKKKAIICTNGCVLEDINNDNLSPLEYSACTSCINPELREYYCGKLTDRRDDQSM